MVELSSSGKIEQMEEALQKKKDQQHLVNTKYKLLVQIIIQALENHLDWTPVIHLIEKDLEEKQ